MMKLLCVSDLDALVYACLFFFKQKTAYEVRISDWSSDVCSSDLSRSLASFGCIATGMMGRPTLSPLDTTLRSRIFMRPSGRAPDQMRDITMEPGFTIHAEGSCLVSFGDTRVLCTAPIEEKVEIGKGSGRERGWQYGEISGVAGLFKKKKNKKE